MNQHLEGALDGQQASWMSLHTNKIQVHEDTSNQKFSPPLLLFKVETTLNGTQAVKGEGEVSSDGKKISVRLGGRGVVYE